MSEPTAGYKRQRVMGLAPWQPRDETRAVLALIQDVLEEYRDYWPITNRQVCYRLVGRFGYEKSEQAFERANEYMNRARRAGMIPFSTIRDDEEVVAEALHFASREDFIRVAKELAADYRMDRQHGQGQYIELWCEAKGMVPQLARVAGEYGVTVRSSSGFNSLTVLHDAASRVLEREVQTVILHVGDHDPSGRSIFDRIEGDVRQLAFDLADRDGYPGRPDIEFERVAVTPAQIARYQLPGAPPKAKDKRGVWDGDTVQAEALPPDTLAVIVESAIEAMFDDEALDSVKQQEAIAGAEVGADVERLLAADEDDDS